MKRLHLSLSQRIALVEILFVTEAVSNSSSLIHSNAWSIIKFSRIKFPAKMAVFQYKIRPMQNIPSCSCYSWKNVAEYRSAKGGRRVRTSGRGMLRELWKMQSQRQCIGWHFETRRRRRHRRRSVLCVSREAREEYYRTSASTCSPLSPPLLILILIILVTLSGLSTAAIPAVFRWGPVTRDRWDKARHHRRRQGRTMPHDRVMKNGGAGWRRSGMVEDFIPG